MIVIKWTGRNGDGITVDRDTVWQEFFKSIGTDGDNRELRQSIGTMETVQIQAPEEIIP